MIDQAKQKMRTEASDRRRAETNPKQSHRFSGKNLVPEAGEGFCGFSATIFLTKQSQIFQRDDRRRLQRGGEGTEHASDNTSKFRLLLQPTFKLADGWDMKSRPLYPIDPPAANKAAIGGLFIVILISAIVGRFIYIGYPFINDSGLYIHLGKTIAEGGRLYHDVFETKFPGAALVCAFFWTILGTNWAGYIAMQSAMSFGGSLALAYSMRRCVGKHAAMPTMLFSMVFLNFGAIVFGGFQLETIQAFFAILAACGVMNAIKDDSLKDAFLAGLAAGVAAMIKPTGAAVVGAFAVAAVFRAAWTWRRVLAHGAMCALGLSISVIAVLLYAWKANILNDLPHIAKQISLYSKGYPFRWVDMIVPITALVVAGFPMYVRMRVFRKARVGSMEKVDRSFWQFAIVWAALELTGICAQGRFSAYYFMVLVPPLAIVYGLLPRRDWALPMAAGLVPIALLSIHLSQGYLMVALKGVKTTGVSEYIAANTTEQDAVWQEQSGRLLLESNRQPGSRYGLTFYFVNYDDAPYDYMQVMLKDFETRKPKYIVLEKKLEDCMKLTHDAVPCLYRNPKRWERYVDAWDHLQQYVKANYRPEIELDGNILWRRIDTMPVQTAHAE